jgi:hypothetical protein
MEEKNLSNHMEMVTCEMMKIICFINARINIYSAITKEMAPAVTNEFNRVNRSSLDFITGKNAKADDFHVNIILTWLKSNLLFS